MPVIFNVIETKKKRQYAEGNCETNFAVNMMHKSYIISGFFS